MEGKVKVIKAGGVCLAEPDLAVAREDDGLPGGRAAAFLFPLLLTLRPAHKTKISRQ